jgi:hypothetical protein
VLRKHGTTDKKRTAEQKSSALKRILDNAVKAEDVQDIFEMAGLDKPNIGLLSDEFLEDVRRMERKNLAVELLERLLQDKIRSQMRTNLVQEKKYSDRLIEALRKYRKERRYLTAVSMKCQCWVATSPHWFSMGIGGQIPPLLDRKFTGDRGDDRDGEGHAGGDEAPRGAGPESG